MLVGCIFAHEAQAAVHLCEIVSTEDEHHLTLCRAVAVHVAHRLDIFLLAVCQHFLQLFQLHAECIDLSVKVIDVMADGIDGTAFSGNLCIQNHQVLQALLNVLLRVGQTALLLFDLLLYLLALLLQALYGGRLLGGLAGFSCLTSFSGLVGGHSFLSRRLTTLLCLWSQGKAQK